MDLKFHVSWYNCPCRQEHSSVFELQVHCSHCSCYTVGAEGMPTEPSVLGHVLEHELSWLQQEEAMGLTAGLACHSVASGGFRGLELRHLVLRTQALGPRYAFWSHPTRVPCSLKICCGSKGRGRPLGAEIPEQRPEGTIWKHQGLWEWVSDITSLWLQGIRIRTPGEEGSWSQSRYKGLGPGEYVENRTDSIGQSSQQITGVPRKGSKDGAQVEPKSWYREPKLLTQWLWLSP